MTKLVGGDKGRGIAYKLPSQGRQIWQMKTPSIYCQGKHRQTLKQHPSSFSFQTQFHSSHSSNPWAAQEKRGHYSQSTSLYHPFPLCSSPLLQPSLFSKAAVLKEKMCLQCGLLPRLQHLLRYQETLLSPLLLFWPVSLYCLSHFSPSSFSCPAFFALLKNKFLQRCHTHGWWALLCPVLSPVELVMSSLGQPLGPSQRDHHGSSPLSKMSRDTQSNDKHLEVLGKRDWTVYQSLKSQPEIKLCDITHKELQIKVGQERKTTLVI